MQQLTTLDKAAQLAMPIYFLLSAATAEFAFCFLNAAYVVASTSVLLGFLLSLMQVRGDTLKNIARNSEKALGNFAQLVFDTCMLPQAYVVAMMPMQKVGLHMLG